MTLESCYHLHGHAIRVSTGSPFLAEAAAEALAGFPASQAAPGEALPVIALEAVASAAEAPFTLPPGTELIRRTEGPAGAVAFALLRWGGRWYFDFGESGLLRLDAQSGAVDGWLAGPEHMQKDWAASFVLLGAIELLRLRGVYAVHGAAVEKRGAGVMLVAPSGGGKTTACISLVRAGYRYLSDDHPLVAANGAGFELLPFPSRLAVSERTIGWFPELARNGLRQDTLKRSFRIEDIYPSAAGVACPPRLLLFLRIADWHESVAEPLTPSRALEELLPQTLLLLEPAVAGRQFQAMAELVRRTRCFRLHFGEDVAALPVLVDRLLG